MHTERVTDKEAIYIITAFVTGSTLIIGTGGNAKNDAWIAAILGFIMAVPMLLVYARILSLFPNNDLYEILDLLFGKFIGKLISVIYIFYAFHLGALVIRNFGEFINTVAMPETPMYVALISMGLVSIVAARMGIEVMGRTTTYFLPLIFSILTAVLLMGLTGMHFEYLKPVLETGTPVLVQSGFNIFSFPFAETVLFLTLLSSLQSKKSPRKIYLIGAIIPTVMIILTTIRNITTLGSMLDQYYFPSYEAVGRISIGQFVERIEVTVAIVFIFCAFMKTSVCLLAASRGISKLFNLKNYRSITVECGLIMICFSSFLYTDIIQMKYWAFKVYPYYAFPMQVIFPIIIWISAEIKNKINAKKA
jgi:spore germination protein KB